MFSLPLLIPPLILPQILQSTFLLYFSPLDIPHLTPTSAMQSKSNQFSQRHRSTSAHQCATEKKPHLYIQWGFFFTDSKIFEKLHKQAEDFSVCRQSEFCFDPPPSRANFDCCSLSIYPPASWCHYSTYLYCILCPDRACRAAATSHGRCSHGNLQAAKE